MLLEAAVQQQAQDGGRNDDVTGVKESVWAADLAGLLMEQVRACLCACRGGLGRSLMPEGNAEAASVPKINLHGVWLVMNHCHLHVSLMGAI